MLLGQNQVNPLVLWRGTKIVSEAALHTTHVEINRIWLESVPDDWGVLQRECIWNWPIIFIIDPTYVWYLPITYPWYTNVWNRHRESKNTKLYEIGSGTKLFITFELKVIRHEEREAQSFYADFSTCPPPRAAPSRKQLVWSRRAPKVNPPRQELNLLLFLKSQPMFLVCDVTPIPWSQFLSGIFIWTSLNDTSSPRAREHLR